jgi:hypothetical protein
VIIAKTIKYIPIAMYFGAIVKNDYMKVDSIRTRFRLEQETAIGNSLTDWNVRSPAITPFSLDKRNTAQAYTDA